MSLYRKFCRCDIADKLFFHVTYPCLPYYHAYPFIVSSAFHIFLYCVAEFNPLNYIAYLHIGYKYVLGTVLNDHMMTFDPVNLFVVLRFFIEHQESIHQSLRFGFTRLLDLYILLLFLSSVLLFLSVFFSILRMFHMALLTLLQIENCPSCETLLLHNWEIVVFKVLLVLVCTHSGHQVGAEGPTDPANWYPDQHILACSKTCPHPKNMPSCPKSPKTIRVAYWAWWNQILAYWAWWKT